VLFDLREFVFVWVRLHRAISEKKRYDLTTGSFGLSKLPIDDDPSPGDPLLADPEGPHCQPVLVMAAARWFADPALA